MLDAASLTPSAVDLPPDPQAALCMRAGFLALRHIADFFRIPYDPDPQPDDPMGIRREEFDTACDELAGLVMAPAVPWSSDRAAREPGSAGKNGPRA